MKTHIGYAKGALFGLVAGLVMAMVAMMATALLGMGLWAMPAMIASLVLGPSVVMAPGIGVIMLGLMLHMMLSAIFGIIYAVIVNAWTHEVFTTAIVFGIALEVVNLHLLPLVLAPARFMSDHEPLWLALITHLVFGIVLGAFARATVGSALKSART